MGEQPQRQPRRSSQRPCPRSWSLLVPVAECPAPPAADTLARAGCERGGGRTRPGSAPVQSGPERGRHAGLVVVLCVSTEDGWWRLTRWAGSGGRSLLLCLDLLGPFLLLLNGDSARMHVENEQRARHFIRALLGMSRGLKLGDALCVSGKRDASSTRVRRTLRSAMTRVGSMPASNSRFLSSSKTMEPDVGPCCPDMLMVGRRFVLGKGEAVPPGVEACAGEGAD